MLHLGIGAGLRDLLDEPVLRYVDRLAGGLFGLLVRVAGLFRSSTLAQHPAIRSRGPTRRPK